MLLVGIDEVGRGCWAGPLVAGAVLLYDSIPGLRDSKKLTKKQRERLDAEIRVQSKAFGLGWVSPRELDSVGLNQAVKLAMERAIKEITIDYDQIIIDGNINFLSEDPRSECVIKADDSVSAVSAASILAKVARDNYMVAAALKYPYFGFEKHVGYGTQYHIDALKKYGICELHRLSFKPISKFINAEN